MNPLLPPATSPNSASKLRPPTRTPWGRRLLGVAVGLTLWTSVDASTVRITFQNLAPSSPVGLYNSPVWFGFHDGGFDLFNPGTSASPGIEALAELGNSSLISAAFSATQPLGLQWLQNNPGGPGPGLFTPGSARSFDLDLDPMTQRYLSFGAMVVPSNDSFIANANPLALALFDPMGGFLGAQTWVFTGGQVWDAGTEMNSLLDGAAFVSGVDALLGSPEGGLIHSQPLDGLDDAIGITTPAGTVIGRALSDTPLFQISVTPVPEPSAYGLVAAVLLAGVAGWRRRTHLKVACRAATGNQR